MKELDSFTVERLEGLIGDAETWSFVKVPARELKALARIALAAKRAEPDYYIVRLKFNDGWGDETVLDTYETKLDASKSKDDHGGEIIPAYTTTQLNSQVPLGRWIKCSDQMPEDDEFVRIWPLPDFGVELHVGQYIKFHKNGPGWFAQVYEHNYGVEFYPITVTHWMPLLAAPEKENG